ncbi:MAG: DUF4249 family protein [Gemmatimonadota bacterium]|nr:DUF4249 family protein [Gemmatimonadota bacterium]MXW04857.1 DUF4249 family protein [Gemmatimonadota bacterium]MYB60936.1 DUF4249 family protein [Gemmatimonadota bacterium]
MSKTTRLPRCITPVLTAVLLAGIAAHPGCSGERDPATLFGPDERETIVVDAVLYVDRILPEIIVTRTRTADAVSTREATSVNDAEVTVIQGLAEYRYASVGHLGRYLPPPGAPRVRPNTEYRLRVRALGKEVRGVTSTPAPLVIDEIAVLEEPSMEVIRLLDPDSAEGNRIAYQEGLIEVRFDPLDVEAYQVIVLEPGSEDGGSPPLEARDGRLLLPWFAIGSSGEHKVEVYALDRNLFDFLRSVEASGQNAFGFGSLAGDTFERPVFNLDGGIGVFGSASLDSFGFFVIPES